MYIYIENNKCYNEEGDSMGKKYDCLNKLQEAGINVHSYENIENAEQLFAYADANPSFSIRFDRENNHHQLPFYTFDKNSFQTEEEKRVGLYKIAREAKKLGCTMVCSNGHQYDDIQMCNFVFQVDTDFSFTLEWSTKKVPLRNMYEYKTSCLKGNIGEDLKEMVWINKADNPIDEKAIENILTWAMKLNIFGKAIEGTLYPEKVGILKENIVCWQLD